MGHLQQRQRAHPMEPKSVSNQASVYPRARAQAQIILVPAPMPAEASLRSIFLKHKSMLVSCAVKCPNLSRPHHTTTNTNSITKHRQRRYMMIHNQYTTLIRVASTSRRYLLSRTSIARTTTTMVMHLMVMNGGQTRKSVTRVMLLGSVAGRKHGQ